MIPLADCKLYAFVDTAYLHGRVAADVARQLCEGGANIIQLRAKDGPVAEVERLAEAILPVTAQAGVHLVINDHHEVAAKLDAGFCHLGQEDFFDHGHTHTSELRREHPAVRIGLSTHSPQQAQRALAAEPDYIAIGPVHATGTKPTAKPVGLELVRWAAGNVTIPWFAIGGLTLHNLDEVLRAGASRICVVSAILNAPDIAAACKAFRARL